MVTLSVFSSSPYTPMTRKSAVTRPPMTADTSAVKAVLKVTSPALRASRGPFAQWDNVPAVYLPPTTLPHEVPGSLVVLRSTFEHGAGLARDGGLVARDTGVRPLDEVHALHLVESALEHTLVRKRALPPIFAQEPGGIVVIPIRGHRVKRLHRIFRGRRREDALFRHVPRGCRGSRTLGRWRRPRAGRSRRALRGTPARALRTLVAARPPASTRLSVRPSFVTANLRVVHFRVA